MTHPPFDPSRAVFFDIANGRVSFDDSRLRVLVPADGLVELCRAAGADASKDFGQRLGAMVGARLANRFRGGFTDISVETLLDHLGGDLAVVGVGSLGLERWGQALVLTVVGSPFEAAGDGLLAAIISGAMSRALSRDVYLAKLERVDTVVRFLVANAETARAAEDWLRNGDTLGVVLERLNRLAGRAP